LDGNLLESLPSSIIQLTSLRGINLTKNKFTSFPDGMKKWIENLEANGCRVKMNKRHKLLL
ncbi:MAG: hypothetical protein ACW987_04105, partial [Candidatus Thorarchaeota archaeon]